MAQEHGVGVGVLKLRQKRTLRRIRSPTVEIAPRQTIAVQAANAQVLPMDSDIHIVLLQHRCPGILIQRDQIRAIPLQIFRLMVPQRHVHRRNGAELCNDSRGNVRPLHIGVEQIPGDENQIRLRLSHQLRQLFVVPPKGAVVEVG